MIYLFEVALVMDKHPYHIYAAQSPKNGRAVSTDVTTRNSLTYKSI